ncbi:hypothetical protein [Polynucleobacter sp. MWH-UH35A]|uniref:hypothetical protein n=1 Tax=Polynucleobacter sp. MWH-UH35A TaxID=1855619 RepID=UPI001BFE9A19|nr:hypothetical protein [Polynucleobacter sp. MWH-UH35A]QWD59746.1 hypothetical protein ICV36_08065 [Polynucleobacter sp. MWH-UH35A]
MNPILLVTCAINPPLGIKYLNLNQPSERLITTKSSIFFWASLGIKKLLIVDSTLTKVLNEEDLELLRAVGIDVEQLSFQQNNEEVIHKGKGFAEGKLLEFAIDNSRLLKTEPFFFKSTGKVFCRNFSKIVELIRSNQIKGIYWSLFEHGQFNTVDTRFFFTSVEDCHNFLLPIYNNLNETEIGKCIEETLPEYFDAMLTKGWAVRPHISGFAGGHGRQWEESNLGEIENSFPCWFKN